MNKSKHFNYFTKGRDPKEQRKTNWRKAWKIIKTFLYVCIFGLTLTGCVQNFTIKTSSTVGNGFEIYTSEKEIAPKVTTFKVDKAKIQGTNTSEANQNSFAYLVPSSINHHVNEKDLSESLIAQLIKQTEANGGKYGEYNSYSSSFRIDLSNLNEEQKTALMQELKDYGFATSDSALSEILRSTNGQYLFKSSTSTGYSKLNQAQDVYYYLTSNDSIFNFLTEKGDNNKTAPVIKKDENGKEYYTIISSTVIGDSNPMASVKIADDVKPIIFENNQSLTPEQKAAQLEKMKLANQAYNSDVFLTLYNFAFGKNSEFFKQVQAYDSKYQSTAEFVKSISGQFNQEMIELKTLDGVAASKFEEFKNFIAAYQAKLISAEKLNVEIKNVNVIQGKLGQMTEILAGQEDSDKITQLKDLASEIRKAWLEDTKDLSIGTIDVQAYNLLQAYNLTLKNYLTLTGYELKFDIANGKKVIGFYSDVKNVDNYLSLRGDAPQKPIYTWGQAWELGPFYGLLVYPLGALIQSIRRPMPDLKGWASIIAIIIAVILTRLVTLALSFRATMMQSLQEDLKVKKAAIEAKYKGFENNKQMKMRKQQELAALHSKYNLNPLDQLGQMLFQMPIFFAMWRVIQGLPEIKATVWLGINFSSTSYQELFSGNWVYLWILAATILVQLASQLLPQWLNKRRLKERATIAEIEALKKSERTQRIMIIVFTVITIMFTAGVQVYWMFGGIWQIGQTLALHRVKKSKWFKERYSKKAFKK
ncbi:membrane protein insertase YidC [Mycoplasma hafezii]|uniref:membrane protein insertase YidC n=1 Tax=Mycoplasma hafezii TaxID=525886 RepID=UPI003CF1F4C5